MITQRFCFRFKGFIQIYQLQTENDEEETWRDLVSCTKLYSVAPSNAKFLPLV